jgi:AhpD family alkylhydroperoxidase
MSINYAEINSRAVDLLLSVKKHTSSIDDTLKALVELRVSQINGCAYCVDLHSNEARKAGESQQKLDCLPV